MKRRQRAGIKKSIHVMRKKKQKEKKGSQFFFLILLLLFSISLIVSYILFKPIFVFDSSFLEGIEAKRPKQDRKKEQQDMTRLYGSNGDTPQDWYSLQNRKDAAIVSTENVIRKYLETYGTNLLDLYIDKKDIIYVDIGKEIRKNFTGDAYEEYQVIARLCASIRTSIPDFSALKILIEGKEAESLGGHIDISRPIRGDIPEIVERT